MKMFPNFYETINSIVLEVNKTSYEIYGPVLRAISFLECAQAGWT